MKESILKKRRKKKREEYESEDHPVHEKYTQQGPIKE